MASVNTASQDADERTDTRRNIKVAARKLFAEHGLEAVTVREIVAAAGAKNGGSLNYYFKSKEGLVRELINEIFNDLSLVWLERISELDRNGGPSCVREIVDIIVRAPNADAYTDPAPTAHRFLASVLFVRRKELSSYMDQMNFLVFRRLLQLISNLCTHLPRAVVRQRLIFFAWYVLSVQAAHEAWRASRRRSDVWTQTDPLLNLVETATALIEADVPTSTVEAKPANAIRPKRGGKLSPAMKAPTA
ncbi:MAG: TetR/AcrR family transcriptional regulator [Sphingobium sp.]